MGAFDSELASLGFTFPKHKSKEPEQKITCNISGPLTCYIARVYLAGRGDWFTEGYIVAFRKKDIKKANTDNTWPRAVKENQYMKRYVSCTYNNTIERVIIDEKSFQAIVDNYNEFSTGYAFVKSVQATKLENLNRDYK